MNCFNISLRLDFLINIFNIILVVSNVAFTLPILGVYQEPFQSTTFIGLIVTLIGFFLWKSESLECFDRLTACIYSAVYDFFGYSGFDYNAPAEVPTEIATDEAGVGVELSTHSLIVNNTYSPFLEDEKLPNSRSDKLPGRSQSDSKIKVDPEVPLSFQHSEGLSAMPTCDSTASGFKGSRNRRPGLTRSQSSTSAFIRRNLSSELKHTAPDAFSERVVVLGPLY